MIATPYSILPLCLFIALALAQSNGMDMSMDMPMNLAAANMLPYLHFTTGDTVWFLGWVPSTAGAMVGACIGVIMLAILERWLAACIALAGRHWAERANTLMIERSDHLTTLPSMSKSSASSVSSSIIVKVNRRLSPFVPEFDITRGILYAAQSLVKILIMLIVMTFQLSFILSIVIGAGVGEALFGRFMLSTHEH